LAAWALTYDFGSNEETPSEFAVKSGRKFGRCGPRSRQEFSRTNPRPCGERRVEMS